MGWCARLAVAGNGILAYRIYTMLVAFLSMVIYKGDCLVAEERIACCLNELIRLHFGYKTRCSLSLKALKEGGNKSANPYAGASGVNKIKQERMT